MRLHRQEQVLIGRSKALSDIEECLLEDEALVTLVGPGGVGKTRLALELLDLLHEAFSVGGEVGAYFCDAHAVSDGNGLAELVMRELTGAVGEGVNAAQVGQALARAGHRLIVIDEVEHILEPASKLLVQWLDAAPDVRFLVTSRAPLGVSRERVLQVTPLDTAGAESDGRRLFMQLARQFVPEGQQVGSVEDIDAIVRAVDGLPLAIELAVGQLKTLSCADIRRRVEGSKTDALGQQRGGGRHTSMARALQDSWDLLSANEQLAMAVAAEFSFPFTGADLEACCLHLQTPVGDVTGSLLQLVERSMVNRSRTPSGDVTYSVFTPVRTFVRAQATSGEAAHAAWLVASLQQVANESVDRAWSDRIVEETAVAVARAFRDGSAQGRQRVVQLAQALESSVEHIGYLGVRRTVLAQAREAASVDNAPQYLQLVLDEAVVLAVFSKSAEAERRIDEALRLIGSRELEESETARLNLARMFVNFQSGDFEDCVQLGKQTCALPNVSDFERISATIGTGIAQVLLGQLAEAEDTGIDALAQARKAGMVNREGRALQLLCSVAMSSGAFERGRRLCGESIDLFGRAGDEFRLCWSWVQRALLDLALAHPDAESSAQIALDLAQRIAHGRDAGVSRLALAMVAFEKGEYRAALTNLDQARDLLQGMKTNLREVLSTQAVFHQLLGHDVEARASLRAAESCSNPDVPELELEVARAVLEGKLSEFEDSSGALANALLRIARQTKVDDASAETAVPTVHVDREGRWFRGEDHRIVDLRARGPARRLLAALAMAYEHDSAKGCTRDGLLEAGWPGETMDRARALNRLKVTLHSLRSGGLGKTLAFSNDEYHLEGSVVLLDQKSPPIG